jgi:hypothetical protein
MPNVALEVRLEVEARSYDAHAAFLALLKQLDEGETFTITVRADDWDVREYDLYFEDNRWQARPH